MSDQDLGENFTPLPSSRFSHLINIKFDCIVCVFVERQSKSLSLISVPDFSRWSSKKFFDYTIFWAMTNLDHDLRCFQTTSDSARSPLIRFDNRSSEKLTISEKDSRLQVRKLEFKVSLKNEKRKLGQMRRK